ncbi:MAG: hypothetical protein QXL06_01870 [Nitrososphaerota archaeon]
MSEFDVSRIAGEITSQPHEILVYQKDTWGNCGQHDNLYVFVIDVETKTVKSIFDYPVVTRREIKDSRKNYHRKTYMPLTELSKLDGKILKFVYDYASSSKRRVTREYYLVDNMTLKKLETEPDVRDSKGFFDYVKLPDRRRIKSYKNEIEIE